MTSRALQSALATVRPRSRWIVRAPDGPRGQGHYIEGPRRNFAGAENGMTLVERLTRISDNNIDYAFTVNDAKTWTRPWTFSLPLTVNDDEPLYEYACHEGNYGLANILSAARVEERSGGQAIP